MARANSYFYDKLGIIVSSTCMIHCLISSIAIILLPVSSQAWNNEWVHLILMALVLPVGGLAFYRGYRQHQMKPVMFLGMIGLVVLLVGAFSENWYRGAEISLTLVGSIALVGAHLWNMRLMRGLAQGDSIEAVVSALPTVDKP